MNATSNQQSFIKVLASLCIACLLNGCAVTPHELDSLGQDPQQRFSRQVELPQNYQAAVNRFTNASANHSSHIKALSSTTFSRGDMLRLRFAGMPSLDGLYQINTDGQIELPFAKSLVATGQNRQSLQTLIETEMVQSKWFYIDNAKVDISLVRLAAVDVAVFGAVFNPGRVSVNNQPTQKQEDAIQQTAGAFTSGRNLVAALMASGGIRPDADLFEVYLKRANTTYKIPLNALLSGDEFTKTPALINGDVIFVKSIGVENQKLIRPSQITPPGMRVFMSNATAPVFSNAQAAVGADSTSLPYGSSLLDAAISANCVGGTHMANASRSLILVTRNYGSQQQLVIKRSINQLLAQSSNSSVNPHLMPDDGIACYDSRFSNFRDVARGISEVVSPIFLGGLL